MIYCFQRQTSRKAEKYYRDTVEEGVGRNGKILKGQMKRSVNSCQEDVKRGEEYLNAQPAAVLYRPWQVMARMAIWGEGLCMAWLFGTVQGGRRLMDLSTSDAALLQNPMRRREMRIHPSPRQGFPKSLGVPSRRISASRWGKSLAGWQFAGGFPPTNSQSGAFALAKALGICPD